MEGVDDTKYCRKFSLTLISGENLPKARKLFGNRIQARITIGGDKKTEKRTPSDKKNGLNPAWNHRVKYIIDESDVACHDFSIVIKMYAKRTFRTDLYVGEVHTSVKALFDCARGRSATIPLPVKKGAETTRGVLNVSYSFGKRRKKPDLLKKLVCCGFQTLVRVVVSQASGIDISN